MKEIIEKYAIRAKKSLGQNFLMDQNILDNIANITLIESENIVEVGPGFGALTGKIIDKKPTSLTLVELDNFMIDVLNKRIRDNDLNISNIDFEIVNQDILKYEPKYENYKVIANIPYYITSPILYKFLYEVNKHPKTMVILMQKEVGEKILSIKSSVLSLFIKRKCIVNKELFVPKGAFSPPPKVDSIVLSFNFKNEIMPLDEQKFLSFIKACFSNPRKKMINNIANLGYDKNKIMILMKELGFNENTRAEELQINDFEYILNKI